MQHTSASLTINENYDSDVREDTETFLNKIVPEVCLPSLVFHVEANVIWEKFLFGFWISIFREGLLLGSIRLKVSTHFFVWNRLRYRFLILCMLSHFLLFLHTNMVLSCVTFAGPDDMPAHIKSSMFGCTLTWDDLILVVRLFIYSEVILSGFQLTGLHSCAGFQLQMGSLTWEPGRYMTAFLIFKRPEFTSRPIWRKIPPIHYMTIK